ncbi:hypothetical protein GALMADRAFT_276641 [Galerina marginata CBS 339.88]|uniref:Uncharacterized protein n=1 Tax=Galerina marginata (strain CBS 339.88) TaxID=685588 RepID=A0A067TST6_GALM3|nr:hypothetical protein GALMADRAFT_276641 [Galerina marginata CBS 339.88]
MQATYELEDGDVVCNELGHIRRAVDCCWICNESGAAPRRGACSADAATPDNAQNLSFDSRQIRAGYSPDPYKFLTNGARAVRAFARPWPVKVVGRAVEGGRIELEQSLTRA